MSTKSKTFTTRELAAELNMTAKNARGRIRAHVKSIKKGIVRESGCVAYVEGGSARRNHRDSDHRSSTQIRRRMIT